VTPVWVRELADAFWRAVRPEQFPRTFANVSLGFHVTVHECPGLSLGAVRGWLARREMNVTIPGPDRRLRGCLVAHGWDGFVFVEADDPPAERRFTLAHELAHYLRDVWHPRRRAVAKLGPRIVDVLDGRRPATTDERLRVVLRGLPVGPVVHLLGRGADESPEVRAAEAAADRLAFELLAPAEALGVWGDRSELIDRLVGTFGLPPAPAGRYAAVLAPGPAGPDRLIRRLLGR
jgi:hypothetical protein